jgi:SnoaL-like domain
MKLLFRGGPMNSAQQVARRYYDAWTSGDRQTVATLLSPSFRIAAGDLKIAGRDVFLASGAFPRDATVTMVAEAYQDDFAFQLYDATRGDRTIRVAEQLTVRDGRVASSNFVTDMAAFAAFAAAGAGSEGRGGGGQA